jgi:hypothetical protein
MDYYNRETFASVKCRILDFCLENFPGEKPSGSVSARMRPDTDRMLPRFSNSGMGTVTVWGYRVSPCFPLAIKALGGH